MSFDALLTLGSLYVISVAMRETGALALWTPLGYQTNLMVYGPGNYRFADFVKLGLPLQAVLAVLVVLLVPLVWSF